MTYDFERGFVETCKTCGVTGTHDVRIEIQMENPDSPYAGQSREPYRITTCHECGSVNEQRMNQA